MSPNAKHLLIVIGIGATIGAIAVPQKRGPIPVERAHLSDAAIARLVQLANQGNDELPATGAEVPAMIVTDGPSLADFSATGRTDALPYSMYKEVPRHRSAFDESVSATTPKPIIPLYAGSSSRPMQLPTGEAPLQLQVNDAHRGLSIANSNAFGTVLNRSGSSNQYFDQNGDSYTQAGPHGVVNNRTGGFSPAN